MPTRYEDGIASSPMLYYHQLYYEAIDTIVSCLKDCFEQPGYQTYSNLERLLIKACQGKEFVEKLDLVTKKIYRDLLRVQLRTLNVDFKSKFEELCGTCSINWGVRHF